jgi:hypothetical protein
MSWEHAEYVASPQSGGQSRPRESGWREQLPTRVPHMPSSVRGEKSTGTNSERRNFHGTSISRMTADLLRLTATGNCRSFDLFRA